MVDRGSLSGSQVEDAPRAGARGINRDHAVRQFAAR
jgi:hypothetical protein